MDSSYKIDILIILNTATNCWFLCWGLRVEQWLQDLYWQPRQMLMWRRLWRLICSRQLALQLPPLYLIKHIKSMCLTGLDCTNCLNLYIYHPDWFLHWTTRSSCPSLLLQSFLDLLFPRCRNKIMTDLIAGYDSPSKILSFLWGKEPRTPNTIYVLALNLLWDQ